MQEDTEWEEMLKRVEQRKKDQREIEILTTILKYIVSIIFLALIFQPYF